MTGVLPQRGATGTLVRDQRTLDALPPGTVVVPLWTGSPAENGLNACTKFAPNRGEPGAGVWLRAIDDPKHQRRGVHPLGGHGSHGVRVVYDPRDI